LTLFNFVVYRILSRDRVKAAAPRFAERRDRMTMALADRATGRHSDLHYALLAVASSCPAGLALRHKHRGEWLSWDWRAVVRSVDVLATVFAQAGLAAGDRITLVGEITPSLLFAALAANALAADVVAMAPAAKTVDILAATGDAPPRLAVIQGRDSLAVWQQARPQLGDIRIVFDHAVPGDRQDSSILIFNDLLSRTAPSHGWAERLPAISTGRLTGETLWVEASTAWSAAIETILARWLSPNTTLALPELLAAAARDRAEIRPTHWLASDATLVSAAQDIASRLPRRLATSSGETAHPVLHRLLGQFARKRLGLADLAVIHAEAAGLDVVVPPAQVFAALGIAVRHSARPGHPPLGIAHHPAARPPFLTAESLS
jgi:hypothetical protein